MKRCPQCNRVETDNALVFCRVDPQARFAVTADGQKFLVNNTIGEATSAPIAVVLNWTADLKR